MGYVNLADVEHVTRAMVEGDVDLIQLRGKKQPVAELVDLAGNLQEITSAYGIPLIVNDYAEILRGALQRGDSLDASLLLLRQQGATIIESIKAIREVNSIDLREAKRLVDDSQAWKDHRESHRLLIDEIISDLERP